jgi:exopolysaccharide production protein ExoZ
VIGLCCLGAHSRLGVMSGAFLTVAAATHPRLATLSNRPLLALGNASYSIYLSHGFIQDALTSIATHLPWRVTWVSSQLYLLVTLAVCAVLGLLCYRYLERPLTTRLRGLIERRWGAKSHAASPLLEKAGALGKPPPYPQR